MVDPPSPSRSYFVTDFGGSPFGVPPSAFRYCYTWQERTVAVVALDQGGRRRGCVCLNRCAFGGLPTSKSSVAVVEGIEDYYSWRKHRIDGSSWSTRWQWGGALRLL